MKTFYAIAFCIFSLSAAAQQDSTFDQLDLIIEENIEDIASASDVEPDFTTLLDHLNYYKEHPLNLNKASKDELEAFQLLNPLQVQALLNHIRANGELIALEELQAVDGFDRETIYRMLPYVTLSGNVAERKLSLKRLQEGKSALFLRYQQVLEEAKGYSEKQGEDTNRYLGNDARYYIRYRYRLDNQISLGFTGQKDAGEEFFEGTQQNGFDFYSAHLFYKGNGFLKSFIAGDYHIQYGQGVTLGTGLSFGKSYDVVNIKKNARGFYPFTSTNENMYLRGGAVSIGGKKLSFDIFYSDHKIDANIVATDTTPGEIASSFLQSGYHRTYSELADKHALREMLYGGHLQYKNSSLNIGLTGYAMQLDKPVVKTYQPYNQFQFKGNYNSTVGVDYSYIFSNVNLFGEVSRSENGALAYLNGALVSLDKRVGVSLLHRHYDKDYQNLFSNAFAESSTIGNEDGLFLGIVTKPLPSVTLSGYVDQFKFPWLRYLADAPSAGSEYMVQLIYTPLRTFEAYLRIKEKSKPSNITGDDHAISNLQDEKRTNYRLHVRYKVSGAFTLSNRVEYANYVEGYKHPEHGILIYQDVNYKPIGSKLSYAVRYIIFDCDSYNSRIYSYENDVLYAYSIPFLYNKGSRFYTVVHYRIVKNVDGWMRYGITVYDDRKTIGSALDQINGNQKSELGAQLRFQF